MKYKNIRFNTELNEKLGNYLEKAVSDESLKEFVSVMDKISRNKKLERQ